MKKKAFPISVDFKPEVEGAPQLKGAIVQVAEHGLMAELTEPNLHAGARYSVTFALPSDEKEITETVRIVKIYSKAGEDPAARVFLVEFHFVHAQAATITILHTFLRLYDRKTP